MSTRRKLNRFLNANRDGSAYTLKPEAQSQHAAYRRSSSRCKRDVRTVKLL
jgi:hypothetical protein